MDEAAEEGYDAPFAVERESGEKAARQIARAIVRDIVGQGLGEGAPLPPEPVMLATYRVGRPTLREALRILEVNGLITIKTGRSGGPRVRRSDTRDLARLLSLHFASRRVTYTEVAAARRTIEPTLARLAALNASETERQQLAEMLHLSAEIPGSLAESQRFHHSVAVISHDPVLGPLSVSLQLIIDPMRAEPTRQWTTLMAEHVPIGEAIIRGAAEEAETLMARHMRHYPAPAEAGDQIVDWA
ncbi:FadR/GntR family transcriptional regulator [Streptomyces gilvus]|uniref:FadR/GntR family transcriptional regulator n=1 Tax=Streptomyces gilvus TaxID=2920937 RepID=UPI001F112F83|nr:FCD domain-containing protein [Streptomyces sp. CME 23]MCH5677584.1 FCD domain-containing protein [Streptomyces sp. CME 23]